MASLPRMLDTLDFLLSWWERLAPSSWNKAVVAVIALYLFGSWAQLTEQPSVVIATVVLVTAASMVVLFTFLPSLLRRWTRPPFAISAHTVKTEEGRGYGVIEVEVFVVNQSSKDNIVLEFALCLRTEDGQSHFFRGPRLLGINREIGPQKHTAGTLLFNTGHISNEMAVKPNGIYLSIVDHVSSREALFHIPGSHPFGFIAS